MSDKDFNQNEDTAALFVSAQKKKKAEEEARRRAAEEEARRLAAEAEVRRMEQEVEERKRKAEEERKALEEEEKERQRLKQEKEAAELRPHPAAADTQGKTAEAAAPPNKMPLFIGIGAAAVVVVVLIVVFALGGKKNDEQVSSVEGTEETQTAESDESVEASELSSTETSENSSVEGVVFDGEYTSEQQGYQIPIHYPTKQYSAVEEGSTDKGVFMSFMPAGEGDAWLEVYLTELADASGNQMNNGHLGKYSFTDLNAMLKSVTTDLAKSELSLENPANEESTIPGNTQDILYRYTCLYDSENELVTCMSWYKPDENGNYKAITAFIGTAKTNPDSGLLMVSGFLENNIADKDLIVPGYAPPQPAENNGLLSVEEIHMGIPVPEGRYAEYPGTQGYRLWSDRNGASLMMMWVPLQSSLEEIAQEADKMFAALRDTSVSTGANVYLSSAGNEIVENREFTEEKTYLEDEFGFAYQADFKETIGGIPYSERFFGGLWVDETSGQLYLYNLICTAPEENRDIYLGLFDQSVRTLEDIQ